MTTINTAAVRFALLASIAISFPSQAQAQDDDRGAEGWGLGLGVSIRNGLYAGEDNRIQPFPLVTYQGERFFFEGTDFGYRFVDNDAVTFSAFVSARLDGIEADDFGRDALAARGIDRDLLEDRDMAADIGLSTVFKAGDAGEFELDVRGDITGTSDGYQASLDYRYPFQAGKTRLIPSVGVVALSDELADYYYGTLSEEVARGVVDYRPGRATIVRAGLTAIVPTGPRWVVIGSLGADAYPDEITDSPLIDRDADIVPSVFLGMIRNFR